MKLLKGIITSIIISQVIFLMIPFNIHAENVGGDSPIIGVNIYVSDYEYSKVPYQGTVSFSTEQTRWQCVSSHSTMGCQAWSSQGIDGVVDDEITGTITYSSQSLVEGFLYEYDFVLDKNYVGSITFNSGSLGATTTSTYFINGSHLVLTSTQRITSFSVSSYNLNALPDGMMTWDFPIESFPVQSFGLENLALYSIQDVNQYKYGIFDVLSGTTIYQFYGYQDTEYYWIFWCNKNISNLTQLNNFFSISNAEFTNIEALNRFHYQGATSYIVKVTIGNIAANGGKTIKALLDTIYMPIYHNISSFKLISTDFALNYGLSNQLLDDLDLIADGTSQSNQSVSDLEDANTQLQDNINEVSNTEDRYAREFDSALNSIDFTSPLQNNAGILPAANFVITAFNGLINNPLSVLIIIFCILTIGKKMIGK